MVFNGITFKEYDFRFFSSKEFLKYDDKIDILFLIFKKEEIKKSFI